MKEGILPEDDNTARNIVKISERCILEEGLLYHLWQPARKDLREEVRRCLWFPTKYRDQILKEHHDGLLSAHLGFDKTYMRIRERFFWSSIYKDVRTYIKTCSDCQRRKHPKGKPLGLM